MPTFEGNNFAAGFIAGLAFVGWLVIIVEAIVARRKRDRERGSICGDYHADYKSGDHYRRVR